MPQAATVPLAVIDDVAWAPIPNTVSLHTATVVPEPWTTGFCLLTRPGPSGPELLLVDVISRGLDVPGGRREPGENVRATVTRELTEETGLILPADTPVTVRGYQHLHVTAPAPVGYPYPHPHSYIAVTIATVPAGTEPTGTTVPEEIQGHRWVPVADVDSLCATRSWVPFLRLIDT